MVSGVRARASWPALPPGVSSPVPHGGLPRPAGRRRRLTPSPAAPRGPPLALTRGSSWRRPAPPQRSAAARRRGRGRHRCGGGASPGAAARSRRKGPGGRLPRARAASGPLAGEQLLRGLRLSRRALRAATVLLGAPGPAPAPPPPGRQGRPRPRSQTTPPDSPRRTAAILRTQLRLGSAPPLGG